GNHSGTVTMASLPIRTVSVRRTMASPGRPGSSTIRELTQDGSGICSRTASRPTVGCSAMISWAGSRYTQTAGPDTIVSGDAVYCHSVTATMPFGRPRRNWRRSVRRRQKSIVGSRSQAVCDSSDDLVHLPFLEPLARGGRKEQSVVPVVRDVAPRIFFGCED